MKNGFYSSMALANTRLKEKRSGNVSISYTQTLQSLLNLFNEEQIKKFSEWIPTNGKTIDITEDLSGFKSYTEQKEKKSKTI